MLLFVINSSYTLSNWILVSWTIERFIAVRFPLKATSWCTVQKVKKAISGLVVVCYLLNIPQLTETITVLSLNAKRTFFYYHSFALFKSFVYMYVPIFILVFCNTVIIIKTKMALKRRSAYNSNQESLIKRTREQHQMTLMLLTVSVVFFLLHLTQALAKIWRALYPDPLVIFFCKIQSLLSVFNYIVYTSTGYYVTDFQNSINFFLYCLFGRKFRNVINQLFCFHLSDNKRSTISAIQTKTTDM